MAHYLTRHQAIAHLLTDFAAFSHTCYPHTPLRRYQLEAAAPILAALDERRYGNTQYRTTATQHSTLNTQNSAFVVLMARQAGKDELLAQLQSYLLARYSRRGGSCVLAAPTFKPQALISRRRLAERLHTGLHLNSQSRDGYRLTCGNAAAAFLSAEPTANARGETASLLLIANEAQDIAPDRWDAVFAPMTASTNAPTLVTGTPWAAGSLLSRATAHAAAAGTLRVADWQRVAEELPAYADHVRGRIAQLGANHPFIRTEYELRELDAVGGLFPADRQAQMHGSHPRNRQAVPGRTYVLLVDVGGGAEDAPSDPAARARERRRDSTALTVVEVDTRSVSDDLLRRPVYRVVDRHLWTGTPHSALLPHLLDLARSVWHARYCVIDATGLGAGLASLLAAALKGQCEVVPFVFSAPSKSALGWAFLATIESGRWKDYSDDGATDTRLYWAQVAACAYTVAPGPAKQLAWAVPAAKGHDDLLVSAALIGALDTRDWRPPTATGRTRADWT